MRPFAFSLSEIGTTLYAPVRALRARRLVRPGSIVVLTIDAPVIEIAERGPWWRRSRKRSIALARVRDLVNLASADPKVRGLLVEIRSIRAGAAVATSLRAELKRFKESGKDLFAYLPMGGGSREMLVASAADRILLGPQSSISPLGIAVETRYLKRTLDKIGILPEVFARGEFKTAGESLVRDTMSNEQREQLGAILDGREEELRLALVSARQLSHDDVRALIDQGPYRAREAVAHRLADGTTYDDGLPREVGADTPDRLVPAARYLAVRHARRPRPIVGVVQVRGPIVSQAPLALGRMAIDEQVMGALRVAGASKSVRAVILLVDSPGGSVLASDRIYHEVVRVAEKKPVVAYFTNVAASGGYYVAAAAHAIVAQSTTITGSIGVVATHMVLSPLLEKLGVVTELVKRGARADMFSASRRLDAGERTAMTHEIEGFYLDFVDIVARGRKRPAEEIEPLARGRVYSGVDAKRVGLVDHIGGFETAIAIVREQLGETGPLGATVIRPPRVTPRPPEIPAPLVDVIDGLGVRDLLALALGTSTTERVLAWNGWFSSG